LTLFLQNAGKVILESNGTKRDKIKQEQI